MNNIYFFTGKGGVGKTTSSLIFGIELSKNKKVKVVSIDPAPNIGDILMKKTKKGKEYKIEDNLIVKEIDTEKIIDKLRKNIKDELRIKNRDVTVFNLEKIIDLVEMSPGVEEEALIYAVNNEIEKDTVVIFDSPPTALFLKFIGMVISSKKWLDLLLKIRKDIKRYREVVYREKKDNLFDTLQKRNKMITTLYNILKNSEFIVVRDKSPIAEMEALRIEKYLKKIHFNNVRRLYNKIKGKGYFLPEIDTPYGYDNLKKYRIYKT